MPSNVPWPSTVTTIDLGYNDDLVQVEAYAFKYASGLATLKMWAASSSVVFDTNALYTTSSEATFEAYFYGLNASSPMFGDNAFGNVDGGQLWERIVVPMAEFRETTFRLMLKAKFDKNAECKGPIIDEHYFLIQLSRSFVTISISCKPILRIHRQTLFYSFRRFLFVDEHFYGTIHCLSL